ncbi:MAG: patatin-like phospholipase family protein [Ardenticatenaceae bacterium]|nr:patatin-like phospholipase family protein [Ardenticatenaceae bacterium]
MTEVSHHQENGRPRVGLALGGGSVRGFAHFGVLTVLEEANIPIDIVAGTSAGAIIGALYAAGMSLNQIETAAEQMSWRNNTRPILSTDGLLTLDPMAVWLKEMLGDLHFEDLALPFACAATDLQTGEPVVLASGPLASAVQASCSVPGIITPVRRNGRLLCDGGITNNVPVSLARCLGADYVIGVDIFEPTLHWPIGPLGRGLAAIEIMVEHAGSGTKTADCLITPNLKGYSYIRFSHRQELIERGQQAAHNCLPTIHQHLQAKQPRHIV